MAGAADWFVVPSNMALHGSDSVSPYEMHYDRQQSMQASILSPFGPALGGGSMRMGGGVATMSAADFNMVRIMRTRLLMPLTLNATFTGECLIHLVRSGPPRRSVGIR